MPVLRILGYHQDLDTESHVESLMQLTLRVGKHYSSSNRKLMRSTHEDKEHLVQTTLLEYLLQCVSNKLFGFPKTMFRQLQDNVNK